MSQVNIAVLFMLWYQPQFVLGSSWTPASDGGMPVHPPKSHTEGDVLGSLLSKADGHCLTLVCVSLSLCIHWQLDGGCRRGKGLAAAIPLRLHEHAPNEALALGHGQSAHGADAAGHFGL